jgi:hypothetical protein
MFLKKRKKRKGVEQSAIMDYSSPVPLLKGRVKFLGGLFALHAGFCLF